ncbi:MAG: GTPase ObgE [Gemmatimonadota bacterium]|jgi:GTP-binding protein|nr:GTPase ObgE [Gemmatimonadota bacterium]
MFHDHAIIEIEAGRGGAGAVSFRRESYIPHGGPDGGEGGRGADIVLVMDPQLSTLMDFRYRRQYRAPSGQDGQGSNRSGRGGEDLHLRVPPGTSVRDADTGEFIGELLEEGDTLVVARGGRGGKGNVHFATPTNQAPRHAQPGEEGEARRVELELKLIADVGLVGEPNAGKSTLLSSVTRATPKVADYPFTTLTPNLGVISLSDSRSFVMADIPGIIEGAHEGRGLGHEFLRHIERTRTLALLIPADALEPEAELELLRNELRSYSADLAEKPYCVVFTKADLLPADWPDPVVKAEGAWGIFTISSVARRGLNQLLEALWRESRAAIAAETEAETEDRTDFSFE